VQVASSDPQAHPLIQPNYLAHAADQQCVVRGMKLIDKIFKSAPLVTYCGELNYPDPAKTKDEVLLEFAQNNGNTAYHPMGTCRMGRSDSSDTVVDDRLRVVGLEGLRIADASVMPTMPSGNIGAVVFMIAEKASDLILEDA
jgi:choline dehydrogenase